MSGLENSTDSSLVDKLFDWWRYSSPAAKTIVLGLAGIWLAFILWLAVTPSLPSAQADEVYLPAVKGDNNFVNQTKSSQLGALGTDEGVLDGAARFVIDPKKSVASYSVVEEFFGDSGLIVGRNTNQGVNTAVGATHGLSGVFFLDMEKGSPTIIAGEFSADLQQLRSVQPHRDDMLKRFWLQSNRYPAAYFVVTEMPTLPPTYTEGTPATFPLTGILTVRNIEKEVTFDVVATLENGWLEALAVTDLMFEDFEIDPPSMAGVLQTEPNFRLIVSIKAEQQPATVSEK